MDTNKDFSMDNSFNNVRKISRLLTCLNKESYIIFISNIVNRLFTYSYDMS